MARRESLDIAELARVAVDRALRWHGSLNAWSLSDWGCATAGEMGEALNVIKKINRNRDGVIGNLDSLDELYSMLGEELADVACYLVLLAEAADIDLAEEIISKFNKVSIKHGFPDRL